MTAFCYDLLNYRLNTYERINLLEEAKVRNKRNTINSTIQSVEPMAF